MDFDNVFEQYLVDNDFEGDVKSLIDFSEYLKQLNNLSPSVRAKLMKKICQLHNITSVPDLSDYSIKYHRLCNCCFGLHNVDYTIMADLFCDLCGNCLCIEDNTELGLYNDSSDCEEEMLEMHNKIQCVKCVNKNS